MCNPLAPLTRRAVLKTALGLVGAAALGSTPLEVLAGYSGHGLRYRQPPLTLGVAATGWAFQDPELGEQVRALMAGEFQQVTIEHGFAMKDIRPERGSWDYETADGYYDWAQQHGLRMRGHALAYSGWATPRWVAEMAPHEMAQFLDGYTRTMLWKYPLLAEVVAVNEPYLPGHPERERDPFHAALGRAYLAVVFGAVREAAPGMVAIYNDSHNHATDDYNGITTQLTHDNLAYLKAAGLIDDRFRLGVQMHLRAADLPDWEDVARTLGGYRERHGCEVIITELDVDMSGLGLDKLARAALHGRIIADVLRAYRASEAGGSVTVWSLVDRLSWLAIDMGLADADAGLFTDSMEAKPAWAALR